MYRNKVITICKKARQRIFADKKSNANNTGTHKWWDGIKIVFGLSKTSPITSIRVNGTILRDIDLAGSISEFFSCVTDDLPLLVYTPILFTDFPDECIISLEAAELALSANNKRKSVRLDETLNWVIKNCVAIISISMCSIFNSSFREDHVPKLWQDSASPQSIDSDLKVPIS